MHKVYQARYNGNQYETIRSYHQEDIDTFCMRTKNDRAYTYTFTFDNGDKK